jgi:hypothetical protein
MRTTLDIDEDVLQAAKELAKAENKTAGQVLSELARKALTASSGFAEPVQEPYGLTFKNGFYVLPKRGGPPVTTERVEQLLLDAELEDAGITKGE